MNNINYKFNGDYAVKEEKKDEKNLVIILEDTFTKIEYPVVLDSNSKLTIPEDANTLEVYLALAEEFDDLYLYRLADGDFSAEDITHFCRIVTTFYDNMPIEYKELNKLLRYCLNSNNLKALSHGITLLQQDKKVNLENLKKLIYTRVVNIISRNPLLIDKMPEEFIDYRLITLAARKNLKVFDILQKYCLYLNKLAINILRAYDEIVLANPSLEYHNIQLENLLTNPHCLTGIKNDLESEQKEIQEQLEYINEIMKIQEKNQSYHL